MPVLTKDHLAMRFRQNWLAKHPVDQAATPGCNGSASGGNLDDSLTSLSWLQNLNIMNLGAPTPPASPQPDVESAKDMKVNPNAVLNYGPAVQIKQEPRTFEPCVNPPTTTSVEKIDYKTNPYVKPPYSYATLICMAMKETKKTKITLSAIYNWITENFMYYRVADPSWQNSIRHNLSLNKCFQKVPRRKDEPGKGGFWRINPDYNDQLVNGIYKKRRCSRDTNVATPAKKAKKENEAPKAIKEEKTHHFGADEDALKGDFTWTSILNQDIDVDGVKIKTEVIIDDERDRYTASPLIAMSPPMSDAASDTAFDDFFGTDLSSELSNDSHSFNENDSPLDLTVQGIKIEAPDWWSESFNAACSGGNRLLSPDHISSGLNTPIAPSPVPSYDHIHPWEEDNKIDIEAAIEAFDVDTCNLLDLGNIPSPILS